MTRLLALLVTAAIFAAIFSRIPLESLLDAMETDGPLVLPTDGAADGHAGVEVTIRPGRHLLHDVLASG